MQFQQGWEQDRLDKRAQAFLASNGVSLLWLIASNLSDYERSSPFMQPPIQQTTIANTSASPSARFPQSLG